MPVLTNMYNPPAEGNICNDSGNALKHLECSETLVKISADTWAMRTKEAEWQRFTLLAAAHGSEHESFFPTFHACVICKQTSWKKFMSIPF